MYLHRDKAAFREIIDMTSNETGRNSAVIEKDYYVTLILRLLSERLPNVVFKGGTLLQKGFHVINRFSEDLDITFNEHIGESRRKKLKNNILKGIGEELSMDITNFEETQSDRDYNAYLFAYGSVICPEEDVMPQHVKVETALGSYAFPTVRMPIDNYIGTCLRNHGREDMAEGYGLMPFEMNLQSIERTFIDKVFALCDYYMEGKSKRYSRHLYDIYKLFPRISFDEDFKILIKEVREHRRSMKVCPSAAPGIRISEMINKFCHEDFYKSDYDSITGYFVEDHAEYEKTVDTLLEISRLLVFN